MLLVSTGASIKDAASQGRVAKAGSARPLEQGVSTAHRFTARVVALAVLLISACGNPIIDGAPAADATHDATADAVPDSADTGASADGAEVDTALDGAGDVTATDVVGGECITDYDCGALKGATPCNLPSCKQGLCGWTLRAAGTPCHDVLQTETACQRTLCDAAGQCQLTAVPVGTLCDAGHSITDCERAICDLAHSCTVTAQPDEQPCGLGSCGNWCQGGKCVVTPSAAYDDGNPCTLDLCDQNTAIVHEPITGAVACDDGEPCTGDGACEKGACVMTSTKSCNDGLPCTVDSCATDGCKHLPDNSACTATSPCFQVVCDAKAGCVPSSVVTGALCDDGDTCTKGDVCTTAGACVGTSNTCACKVDSDCDNTDLCQPRQCVSGQCEVDDAAKVTCDASGDSACGKNTCNPKSGDCVVLAMNGGKPCVDNNVCTTASACKGGVCEAKTVLSCDDKNPCTADTCHPINGCVTSVITGSCDDGVLCTDNDSCQNGGCVGQKKPCDDNVGCTFDTCTPASGMCANTPQNKACDDANPCTDDHCDATKGCVSVPAAKATCDDGQKCTVTACAFGKCVVTSVDKTVPGCACTSHKDCDDNNSCTQDACTSGDCVFAVAPLEGKPCVDANLCLAGSTCGKGACTGGKPKECNDDNPCTTDSCNPMTGACATTVKSSGTACDDGDVCTKFDKCATGGTCKGGFSVTGPGCDDGDPCTAADACTKGGCAGTPLDCDDGNPCSSDACSKTTGACSHAPASAGLVCAQNAVCTLGKCAPITTGWAADIESGGASRHICALRHDKTMACWGRGYDGQIGDGSKSSKNPKPAVVVGLINVAQMAVGFDHTCALRTDKKLLCWGANTYGQCGGALAGDVVKPTLAKNVPSLLGVWAGYRRTCGQDLNSKLWCWGYGPSGERGDGSTASGSALPSAVKGLPTGALAQVDVRSRRTCVVTVTGQLWCWGYNANQDVAPGGSSAITIATKRTLPIDVGFTGGGRYFQCAVAGKSNAGQCWGANSDGQLGAGTLLSPIADPAPFVGVAVTPLGLSGGRRHLIILGDDGKLYGAGSGNKGALGNGLSNDEIKVVAAKSFPLTYVKAIAFDQTTCALGVDGEVYCVGDNNSGQLGIDSTDNISPLSPSKVLKP